jgi:hypothetical protein
MIDAFWEIWLEAKKESKGRNTTLVFQELLRAIKTWNGSISLKHADAIKNSNPIFPNLLAAVFICHVKILLNGIRMDKKPKKISIKLPANDVFVQRCYEACGEDLYYRPLVISESKSDEERKKELTERFTCRIHTVIDNLIPWDEIVGDLKHDAADFEDENEEEAPAEAEELPEPSEMPNLDDMPNNISEPPPSEEMKNSTQPVGETPGGSQVFNVTPSLNPPAVNKLGTNGESLFEDAREN